MNKKFLLVGSFIIPSSTIISIISCSSNDDYRNIKWDKLLSNWQKLEGFKAENDKEIYIKYLGYYLEDFKNFNKIFNDKNVEKEYINSFQEWFNKNKNKNGNLKLKGIWKKDKKIPKYKGIAKLFYCWAKMNVIHKGGYKKYDLISYKTKKPIFDSIFQSLYTMYNRVQVQSSEATGGYSTMNEFYWNNRAKFWGDLKKWARLYSVDAFEERNPVADPNKPKIKLKNTYKHNKDLLNIIKYTLNAIVEEKFYYKGQQQYVNWWPYEIGFPRIIFSFLLPIRKDISTNEANKYMSGYSYFKPNPLYGREAPTAINAYKPTKKLLSTGGNLADNALNAIKASILTQDKDKLKFSISVISDYILKTFTQSGDGFYRDGGFIQHSNVPYIGTYGSVLLLGIANLAYILEDSGIKIFNANSAFNNIFPIIEKSVFPFIYRGVMTSTIGGRGITRHESEFYGVKLLISISMLQKFASPIYKKKFNDFLIKNINQLNLDIKLLPIDSKNSKNDILKSQWDIYSKDKYIKKWIIKDYVDKKEKGKIYQVWSNDRVNVKRDGYMASFSFHSSRIGNFEGMNGENLQGMYHGDGMTLIQTKKDSNSYTSQYWWGVNPYRLPGTTSDISTKSITDKAPSKIDEWRSWIDQNASKSILGYSSGTNLDNIASIFGIYSNFNEKLKTKKSVFILEDQIVVLGKTNNWDKNGNISTTIDNRMGGNFNQKDDKFIYTGDNGDYIGYKILQHSNKIKIDKENARPAWLTNRRYYKERNKPKYAYPTKKKFNSIRVEHDLEENSNFAYIVAPSVSKFNQLDSLSSRIKIIENNSSRQAIEYTNKEGERYLLVNFLSQTSGSGKYEFLYSPKIKDKLLNINKNNPKKIAEISKNSNVEISVNSPSSLIFKRSKIDDRYIYQLSARSADHDKNNLKIKFNKEIINFLGPFPKIMLDNQLTKPHNDVYESIANLEIETQWVEKTRVSLVDGLFFVDSQSLTLHFDKRYKFNNPIVMKFILGE